MQRAAETHFSDPDTAGIVHLGDGLADLSRIDTNGLPIWRVRGNYEDYLHPVASESGGIPRELMFEVGGYKILIMHGHRFSVKEGWERAAAYAADMHADLLMFGHTHVMFEKYLPTGTSLGYRAVGKPLCVFNPGSVGTGLYPSYSVVDLRPDGIIMSHACGGTVR